MVKKRKIKESKRKPLNWAFWAPRVLMIIYIGLLSALSLNAVNQFSGAKLLIALLINLIPSMILFIFLIVSLYWNGIGAYLFAVSGLIFGFLFHAFDSFDRFSLIILPIWAIALLFFATDMANKYK